MFLIKNLVSKIVYGTAKTLEIVFEGLIQLIANIIVLAKNLAIGCFTLISMGGCLFFLLIAGPLGIAIFSNPLGLFLLAILILMPIYGARFAVYLKYVKYITTEYLYNLANYLKDEANYRPFNEFKIAYQKAEEERIRREQYYYYERQRQWEERIRQQWEQSFQGRQGGYYGGQWDYGTNFNPNLGFKNEYEKSCEILGVPYNADKAQIRTAYRRKAKEYHPDLNKAPTAAQMFNEINKAYEFLSEENIQRYKSL